jgi:hypothetical protein
MLCLFAPSYDAVDPAAAAAAGEVGPTVAAEVSAPCLAAAAAVGAESLHYRSKLSVLQRLGLQHAQVLLSFLQRTMPAQQHPLMPAGYLEVCPLHVHELHAVYCRLK